MLGKIKSFSKNPLLFGMLIVSIGNILSSFFSYYFNFLIQSLFPGFHDFGDFVFVLTFLTLSQIIPSSISSTLNLIVTELKVKNEFAKLTLLYIRMLVLFSIVGFAIGSFVFVISNQISSTFQIQNVLYIQLLGVMIFLATSSIPVISFLYGLLKFKSYSFILVFGVIFKILVTLYFFNQGSGFISIFYGFILSYIACFILGNILLISHFDPKYRNHNISEYSKRLLFFSLPMFFILTGSSVLNQIDFMIIKSKLDVVSSGIYGYLINLGKIFYFGSLVFTGAMVSQITESLNKKENYFKIFFFYSKIILTVVFTGFTVIGIFTREFLDLFIRITSKVGLSYDSLKMFYEVMDYITLYVIFISLYILINFLVMFLISTSTFRIYVSFIISVLMQAILIFTLANDIYTIIYCNILVSSLLLIYLLYEVYRKYISFNHSSHI
jgi:O-antigen/teichoic acid export membrane protein